MQHPNIVLNWLGIGLAVVGAFIFGGIWYGPIFGKTWGRLMGFPADYKPDKKAMRQAMVLQLFGVLLTSFVMAHSNQVWRPSVWGVGTDDPSAVYGFFGGFFTWLGFYVPLQLNKVGWEGRPWKLFFINSGHDFVNLQIVSQIIAHLN